MDENQRGKFNDLLLSNQTLSSPSTTPADVQNSQYHQQALQEGGINIGHPGKIFSLVLRV